MAATSAYRPKTGIDVKWILQIVDGKETGRSKPTLHTTSHPIDLDRLVKLMQRRRFYTGLFQQDQAIARDFAHLT
jgi:hypothetical protein